MKSFVNVGLIKTALSRLISAFSDLKDAPSLTKAQIIDAINTTHEKNYTVNDDVVVTFVDCTEKLARIAVVDFGKVNGWKSFNKEIAVYDLPWFDKLLSVSDFSNEEIAGNVESIGNIYSMTSENQIKVSHSFYRHPPVVIEKGPSFFAEERFYVITCLRQCILNKRKKGIFNFFRGNKK